MRRPSAILALMLVALAAGCGDDGGGDTTTQASPPNPAAALRGLLAAARSGDADAVRRQLTPSTPPAAAGELVDGLGSFPASSRIVLAEQIDGSWAVAALAGPRGAEGTREYGVFAVPLRLLGGQWKAEIRDAVTIRPLGPDPGSAVGRAPTQVAAEFRARPKIVQAGLWLDGVAIPGTTTGTPRRYTAYGASQRLTPGRHVAVAFAEAGGHATAVAWTFRVR